MDAQNLMALVEQLDDNIDDLEEQLEPLLAKAFSATTKKLPVLDRAKLYVLVTYTIESLLFSYIRLHGQNAKEHPVFKELSRVRLYFTKLKEAESGETSNKDESREAPKRANMSLDKEAAARIINHGLAGNEKYDLLRAEREAREKLIAQRKLQQLNKKQATKPLNSKKRFADTEQAEEISNDSPMEADDATEDMNTPPTAMHDEDGTDDTPSKKKHKSGRKKSKAKRSKASTQDGG